MCAGCCGGRAERRGGPVPALDLGPLGVRQQVELLDRAARVGGQSGEQRPVVAGHPRHRGLVEEVAVVLEQRVQAVGLLVDVEQQVEHRGVPLHRDRGHLETLQPRPPEAAFWSANIDLEDRLVAGLAGRRQLLDQTLEGKVLVGERGERAIANLPQQLGAGGGRAEVGAHDQGVGEEADQRLELDAPAVGDGRADQDRVLPRVAVKEGLEGGQQRHEEGHALAAGEIA